MATSFRLMSSLSRCSASFSRTRGIPDFGRVLEEVVERPELLDQALGRFFSDPRDAGDVVRGVPSQGEDVGHLGRARPEDLQDLGLVEEDVFRGVIDEGELVHELEEVLVGRDDHGRVAPGGGPAGQRPEDVVGFVSRLDEDRDAEGRDHFLELRDLDDQIVGHRLAVGFVVLEEVVPEIPARGIEDDPQPARLFPVDELPESGDEPVDGVRREPPRGRKPLKGEEGPVKKRISIDQIYGFIVHERALRGPGVLLTQSRPESTLR